MALVVGNGRGVMRERLAKKKAPIGAYQNRESATTVA